MSNVSQFMVIKYILRRANKTKKKMKLRISELF